MLEALFSRMTGAAALALLVACSESSSPKAHPEGYETLELRYEGSTNNVTFPELAEDLGYLAPVKLKYIGNNSTGGPHSIQTVVTGDTDFGSSFNGAIIKLIAAGAPIRAVLASYGTDERTFSGFYTLEGNPVRSARDLIGKKVAMNTLGAHAEFSLRDYLRRNGLTPAEAAQVMMVVLPPVNCELALRNHQVDLASFSVLLRDKALERGGIRMLFSDYEVHGAFNAGSFVMSKRFITENPNTARKFVQGVGRAIQWARTSPREQVIARYESIVKKRGRNEDASVLRYWKSTGISTDYGELAERHFKLWVDWLVADGQLEPGQLQLRDLYTNSLRGDERAAL